MTQILGAVLVAAGSLWLGEAKAGKLRARVKVLHSVSGALEQMERELQLRLLPLPALMEELSRRSDPVVRPLFKRCRAALEDLQENSFAAVWPDLVAELPALDQQDRGTLLPLGQILGRYDAPGQVQAIAGVRRELARQLEQARTDSLRLGRVYRAVGAAGGGFLIILLL